MSTSYRIGSTAAATIDGQEVHHGQHLSGIAIAGFVIIGLLLAVFAYFYISPLLLKPGEPEAASQQPDPAPPPNVDTEAGGSMNQSEKNSLMAWMRRRSRGRFADTTGSNRGSPPSVNPINSTVTQNETSPGSKRKTTFFSRISIVPHLALPPAPQRAHTDRPITQAPSFPAMASSSVRRPNLHTAPPTVSSPLAPKSRRARSKPHSVSASRTPLRSHIVSPETGRSRSVPFHHPKVESNPRFPNATTFQLGSASRSASEGGLLRPGGAPHLTIPSKAMVIDRKKERSNGLPVLDIERSPTITGEDKNVTPTVSTRPAEPEGAREGTPRVRSKGTPGVPF